MQNEQDGLASTTHTPPAISNLNTAQLKESNASWCVSYYYLEVIINEELHGSKRMGCIRAAGFYSG